MSNTIGTRMRRATFSLILSVEVPHLTAGGGLEFVPVTEKLVCFLFIHDSKRIVYLLNTLFPSRNPDMGLAACILPQH